MLSRYAALHNFINRHNPLSNVRIHIMHSLIKSAQTCLPASASAFLFLADMRVVTIQIPASASFRTWQAERLVLQNAKDTYDHSIVR